MISWICLWGTLVKKIQMFLEKEFAYLLNRCYNLHKAFPLVFCGRSHFHYNTWGYAFFFVFFQICSFIVKRLIHDIEFPGHGKRAEHAAVSRFRAIGEKVFSIRRR